MPIIVVVERKQSQALRHGADARTRLLETLCKVMNEWLRTVWPSYEWPAEDSLLTLLVHWDHEWVLIHKYPYRYNLTNLWHRDHKNPPKLVSFWWVFFLLLSESFLSEFFLSADPFIRFDINFDAQPRMQSVLSNRDYCRSWTVHQFPSRLSKPHALNVNIHCGVKITFLTLLWQICLAGTVIALPSD